MNQSGWQYDGGLRSERSQSGSRCEKLLATQRVRRVPKQLALSASSGQKTTYGVFMKVRTLAVLAATHGLVAVLGFAVGIYALPILIAPPAPSDTELEVAAAQAVYVTQFVRDLQDSDTLHWGEGEVTISRAAIALMGELAPGPDYRLYLSPVFVQTEAEFGRLREQMVRVGDVKTFNNFVVPISGDIDPADYNSVIIWCETFGQFITAAQYRD